MDRRTFLTGMSRGWLGTMLLGWITACTRSFQRVGSPPRADGFQMVGSLSDLEADSGRLEAQLSSTSLVVLRSSSGPTELVALSTTCPHAGCKVNWQGANDQFVCPCHGSRFDAEGKVVRGPAVKPLSQYPVKVEGQAILVRLS